MNIWLRLSATFHEHPKMLALRKDAGRAADSAELGWYRVLMASKRYGKWTFASEEHLQHVAGSFYRYVPLYRKHRLLDGLTVHDGESYNAVKTPAERKEEQRDREKSRDDVTDERDTPRDQNVTLEEREEREESKEREDTRAQPEWDDPEHEAVVWLARHGCDIRPGNGYHQKLVLAVEQHGVNAVIGTMDRLAEAGTKTGDIKGFLFGAIDALNARSRPSLSVMEKEDRDGQRSDSTARRVLATKIRAHETGGHERSPSPGCPRCEHRKSA